MAGCQGQLHAGSLQVGWKDLWGRKAVACGCSNSTTAIIRRDREAVGSLPTRCPPQAALQPFKPKHLEAFAGALKGAACRSGEQGDSWGLQRAQQACKQRTGSTTQSTGV